MSTEIAQQPSAFGSRGIEIRSYDDLVRFSKTISASGLAPKGMENPQTIFVVIQMGMEVGLSPMASLQNIASINGRPSIWGDAVLAVCRGTGELEVFEEWYESGGEKSVRNPVKYEDDTAAVCRVKRKGGQVIEQAFSVADAKRAGLWGKAGPWTQFPFRMLRNRARSFALRDGFGDALRGLRTTEEIMDEAPERVVTGRASDVPAMFSLSNPDPEEPKTEDPETIQSRCERDGLPFVTVMEILAKNQLIDTQSEITSEQLAQILDEKMWSRITKAVTK